MLHNYRKSSLSRRRQILLVSRAKPKGVYSIANAILMTSVRSPAYTMRIGTYADRNQLILPSLFQATELPLLVLRVTVPAGDPAEVTQPLLVPGYMCPASVYPSM